MCSSLSVALGTCRVFLGMGIQEQLAARNVAAAIVVAGVYIATSLTYSGTLSGEGGGFWILLLFFLLGQLALLGITYAFRWLTSYDDVQEIAAGNVAAALALTGLLIAVGLIVRWAVAGDIYGFLPFSRGVSPGAAAGAGLLPGASSARAVAPPGGLYALAQQSVGQ